MAATATYGPKQRSLLAFLLMCSLIAAAIAVSQIPAIAGSLVSGLLAVAGIVAGFWIAVRIRCSNCGVTLSTTFPYMGGGAILLWAVNEQCRKCGQPLR